MEKTILSISDLVKLVSTECGETQKTVRKVIDAVCNSAKKELANASKEKTIEVKIMPGLSLESFYVESHEARNPRTGETTIVAPKNRVKAKLTPSFKASVNE